MTRITPEQIVSKLKDIDYIRVGSPIKKFFTRRVVGWNVYSSSLLRKDYRIDCLISDINEMNLPLEVVDDSECTNAFKVFII